MCARGRSQCVVLICGARASMEHSFAQAMRSGCEASPFMRCTRTHGAFGRPVIARRTLPTEPDGALEGCSVQSGDGFVSAHAVTFR